MLAMKSLRYLYRIGYGPSSSHSIAPYRAAKYLRKNYPDVVKYEVCLYGSLALTGRGHLTDTTILNTLAPIPAEVIFDIKTKCEHPNTMKFVMYFKDGHVEEKTIISIGGGAIRIDNELEEAEPEVYPEANFSEITKICGENGWDLVDYVRHYEGEEIFKYLGKVYDQMMKTVDAGLEARGELPGKLHVQRRAYKFLKAREGESVFARSHRLMLAYAFATGEENASGHMVVTAPTCGAAATLPALIKYNVVEYNASRERMINTLAVAGVIGNVIKQNGSISGAVAGCQAEIGSACSMAAAALAYLKDLDIHGIECAAEVAMEHSLGSTCDPVGGYVQIPCIERNGIAVERAVTSARLAEYVSDSFKVSFDQIVETMLETGKAMKKAYRETSKGGLAKSIKFEDRKEE